MQRQRAHGPSKTATATAAEAPPVRRGGQPTTPNRARPNRNRATSQAAAHHNNIDGANARRRTLGGAGRGADDTGGGHGGGIGGDDWNSGGNSGYYCSRGNSSNRAQRRRSSSNPTQVQLGRRWRLRRACQQHHATPRSDTARQVQAAALGSHGALKSWTRTTPASPRTTMRQTTAWRLTAASVRRPPTSGKDGELRSTASPAPPSPANHRNEAPSSESKADLHRLQQLQRYQQLKQANKQVRPVRRGSQRHRDMAASRRRDQRWTRRRRHKTKRAWSEWRRRKQLT